MLPKLLFNPKNLHADRDIVFEEDFNKFYLYVETQSESQKEFTYNHFKLLWKGKKMSLLHFIKTKEESIKEYYEVLYGEIQSMNLLIKSFFSQRGLITEYTLFIHYTLFTLHNPTKTNIK